MTKSVCMLNSVSETLDEILSVSKISRDMKGFDFDYSSLNKKSKLVPPVKRMSLLCQIICHNIIFDIITSTLFLTVEVLGCVTIVANRVI